MAMPFDISKQSVGAQKAYKNFQKFYGKAKGEQYFVQKAEEQGTGSTLREKVNSTYKTGATLSGRKPKP